MATLIDSRIGSTSSSLMLLRTGAEVSGHIDLCQRFQNENLLSYLSGAKRLVPKMRDLTFYNWAIGMQLRPVETEKTPSDSSTVRYSGKADFRSSANFEVVFEAPSRLFLKHRASSAMIDVSKSGFGDAERCITLITHALLLLCFKWPSFTL